MKRREMRLMSGKEGYPYTEDLLHHFKKFEFFSWRHKEGKGGSERSIWKQFQESRQCRRKVRSTVDPQVFTEEHTYPSRFRL